MALSIYTYLMTLDWRKVSFMTLDWRKVSFMTLDWRKVSFMALDWRKVTFMILDWRKVIFMALDWRKVSFMILDWRKVSFMILDWRKNHEEKNTVESSRSEVRFMSLLTCMCPLVDLQIFTPRKQFPTAGDITRKRLLSRVHANVIDQLVLGLEGLALPRTLLPITRVIPRLGSPDMVHLQMIHHLKHVRKDPATRLARMMMGMLVRVDPHTLDGLFQVLGGARHTVRTVKGRLVQLKKVASVHMMVHLRLVVEAGESAAVGRRHHRVVLEFGEVIVGGEGRDHAGARREIPDSGGGGHRIARSSRDRGGGVTVTGGHGGRAERGGGRVRVAEGVVVEVGLVGVLRVRRIGRVHVHGFEGSSAGSWRWRAAGVGLARWGRGSRVDFGESAWGARPRGRPVARRCVVGARARLLMTTWVLRGLGRRGGSRDFLAPSSEIGKKEDFWETISRRGGERRRGGARSTCVRGKKRHGEKMKREKKESEFVFTASGAVSGVQRESQHEFIRCGLTTTRARSRVGELWMEKYWRGEKETRWKRRAHSLMAWVELKLCVKEASCCWTVKIVNRSFEACCALGAGPGRGSGGGLGAERSVELSWAMSGYEWCEWWARHARPDGGGDWLMRMENCGRRAVRREWGRKGGGSGGESVCGGAWRWPE